MSAKTILVLCAQAFLIQSTFSQCTSRAAVDASGYGAPYGWAGPGLAYNGLASPALAYDGLIGAGRGLPCDGIYPAIASAIDFTPTSGGGLPVTSSSAIPPTGISVVSENAYEGALSVVGELPFVGSTAVEALLPTAGAGAINHDCGNGVNAMVSEPTAFAADAIAPAAIAAAATAPAAITPAAAISPAGPIAPAGLGLGNRFGFRGCGGRGLMY